MSPRQRPPRPAPSAFSAPVNGGDQEEYRAGFEAGVQSIDPDIEFLAVYLSDFGYRNAPSTRPMGAETLPVVLYDAGADVIFTSSGRSGVGVFEAASELSTN